MDVDPTDLARRVLNLEAELRLQREEAAAQNQQILALLSELRPRTEAPAPLPQPEHVRTTISTERLEKVKPSSPPDFDGSRKEGRAFLNSCELYMQLVGSAFANDQQKIHWVLTFCKSGRAAKFAERVLRAEKGGLPKYETWKLFVTDFAARFCESNEQVKALTKLEGDTWYQRGSSIDDYIDGFEELTDLANLATDAGLVMKFRRGLTREVQDKVAEMHDPPSLDDLEAWKGAARRVYQNLEANRAFAKQTRTLPTTPSRTVAQLTPRAIPNVAPPSIRIAEPPNTKTDEPIPMEVDASKQRRPSPALCFRCHKPGHRANECPLRYDIRTLTRDEKIDLLEQLLTEADLADVHEEKEDEEEKDFPPRNE
jgi:hypothetical protein